MRNLFALTVVICFLSLADSDAMAAGSDPIAKKGVVFAEQDGLVTVEAEHFADQTETERRAFHLTTADETPSIKPDGDPSHVAGASGGAYLEVLPDTRRTHADKLIRGENFSPDPGKLAVLHYQVHFTNPGRYYVWVRAHSTGSEDNGLHVGIDGTWPESGQRLQWCNGKQTWHWESKQRTEQEHCGEPYKIYLDVEQPGEHTIAFSMREDGFEFDKWLMTMDREFARPADAGPAPALHHGELPEAFQLVVQQPRYPKHWGEPPQIQTRDIRPLPGGYGQGSSTLANWIQANLDKDAAAEVSKGSPTKPVSDQPQIEPRKPDGDGSVEVSGQPQVWHKVTLTFDGPYAHEQDNEPNPFTDYRLAVTFRHSDGTTYEVPGFFAADGDAANSSAQAGTKWRVHFAPDRTGSWSYQASFLTGKLAALGGEGKAVGLLDGKSGKLEIAASDASGRDLRAHGRLQYVGKHYLQFAATGQYFLKVGADAPETLLAYADFDDTVAGNPRKAPLKTWAAHVKDWSAGDPTWKDGKGKGLIGAVNYLSGKGCNAFSFLTYNAGGDGDNVWPFIQREDKLHYDCSKLDQWGIVFDHGTQKGMYLHFKMQETENDDHKRGKDDGNSVPESLDGGDLGSQRKLYCRELIARFGHNLALNWNLGEENTQSTAQQIAMIDYLAAVDPYDHPIVVHTFPDQQDKVYRPLLGNRSKLSGASLQNSGIDTTHEQTVKWVKASDEAGKPWVVAFDESGSAAHGQCPDLGYEGFDGHDRSGKMVYTEHEVRQQTLWGTLMAGGAGCEYYFGYQFAQNDIVCEDWRSRDRSWDYCRIAIEFFHQNDVPFWEMVNRDELVGNPQHGNDKYCFAKENQVYLVYVAHGGTTAIDLSDAEGEFQVAWYNPRSGGDLQHASVTSVSAGGSVELGPPPSETDQDWLIMLRK